MTPARRQKTPTKEPDRPPQLMVSAEQLKAELTDRLALGQELLDQPINDEASLEARRNAYQTWSEYNEALLQRSFDSPKPANDYAWSVGIGVGRDTPFATRCRFLTEDISEKMRHINSLKGRLDLFRIHPDGIVRLFGGRGWLDVLARKCDPVPVVRWRCAVVRRPRSRR